MQNKEKRNMLIWLAVGLVGLVLIMLPYILPIDMMDGGGAMIMVGILMLITGPVVALLYRTRSRVFDELMNANNLIARFEYSEIEWQRFLKDEKRYRYDEQVRMQWIVLFVSIPLGAAFWYGDPASGWIVAIVLVLLNLLIIGVVYWNTKNNARLAKKRRASCLIGRDGLLLDEQLHVWRGWWSRLEGVRVNKKNNMLEITYSIQGRYGRQYYTIRVPIPERKEKEAGRVVERLK